MTDQTLPKYFRPLPVNVKRVLPKIKDEYLKSKIIEADSQFASLNWDDFEIQVLYPSRYSSDYSTSNDSIRLVKEENNALVLDQEKIEKTKYTKVKLRLKRSNDILNKYKDPNKEYLFKFNSITLTDFFKTHYADLVHQTFDGSQINEVIKLLKRAFGEGSISRYDIKDERENILETYLIPNYFYEKGYTRVISDDGKTPSEYFNEKVTELVNTINQYFNEYENKEDKNDFDLGNALFHLYHITEYVTLPDYDNNSLNNIIRYYMNKKPSIIRTGSDYPNALYNHFIAYKDLLTNVSNYSLIGSELSASQENNVFVISNVSDNGVTLMDKHFNYIINRDNYETITSLKLVLDNNDSDVLQNYTNRNNYKPGMFDQVKDKLAYVHFKYDVPENTNLFELPNRDELTINVSVVDLADVE